MAGGLIFLWGRSAVKSFSIGRENKIAGLPTSSYITMSSSDLSNRSLTPTATQWQVISAITSTPQPTQTLLPTSTPWYTNIYIPPVSGLDYAPEYVHGDAVDINVQLSYYWPPLADKDEKYKINCDVIDGKLECEYMASGLKVVDYVGIAVACPEEFPFRTVFRIGGKYYVCLDRGGAIVRTDNNTVWIDVLYPFLDRGYYWGEIVNAQYYLP